MKVFGRAITLPVVVKTAVVFAAVVGTAALLSLRMTSRPFERMSWPLYDVWQRAAAMPAPDDVVVVLITQASLDEFKNNPDIKLGWPWPREVYGSFLDTASKLGAKSVVFDILFDSPSTYGVADDEAFNAAIKRFSTANPKSRIVFPAPSDPAFHLPNSTIMKDVVEKLYFGAVNLPVEVDGTFRRVPMNFSGTDGNTYPSLGAAVTFNPELVAPMPGKVKDEHLFGEVRRRSHWLKFYSVDSIQVVEIHDVFRVYQAEFHGGVRDASVEQTAAILKGKHWMVGAAAAGLYDLRPFPTDERAPGVMSHATKLLNDLRGEKISRVSNWANFLAYAGFGLWLGFLALFSRSPRPALIGTIGVLFLFLPLASRFAWFLGYWFNPIPAIVAFGGLSAIFLSYRFQTEWRERERLAKSVENSMSSSMVQMIRSGKLNLARFGERREISMMFSDLSGFTTLAEATDAAKLVEILNLYLDECVDLVFKHGGYVDKFIGDAIMALWGAPVVGQTNHAKLAVRTALDYKAAVDRFNVKACEKFGFEKAPFLARVGVHTGPAIVGNIGSHSRYNYTAIGDSVNLASRLEGLGKYYDVTLLISEEALTAAGELGSPEVYRVDSVAVKGRSKAVVIYSATVGIPSEQLVRYKEGFAHYQRREWDKATEALVQAPDVPPAQVIRERCQMAKTRGELKQLKEGVWHHDEK